MSKQRKQRVTEAEVAAALGVWMRWACSGETLHDRMRASLEAALSSRASQATPMVQLRELLAKHSYRYNSSTDDQAFADDLFRWAHSISGRAPQAGGEGLRLLREARQYVSDASSDEDPEAQRNSAALLAEIDRALASPTPAGRANQSQEDWARELHSYLALRRALFILDRETAALRFTHLDSSSLRWAKERIREALASTPAQDEVETLRRALFASLYAINWTASDSWDSGRESRARLEWARDKIQRALGGRLDNNQLASIGKQFLAETGAREALSRPPYQGDPEALQDAIKLERRGKSE